MENNTAVAAQTVFVTSEAFLAHWQGHRGLTRRVIEAFPEEELFSFSIGGMRPFSAMALELIGISGSGIKGAATGQWDKPVHHLEQGPSTKAEILALWDEVTEAIDTWFPQITAERLQASDRAFGQYEGTVFSSILYFIDNEIHHRGEGYVYLRALNIEPPYFWQR